MYWRETDLRNVGLTYIPLTMLSYGAHPRPIVAKGVFLEDIMVRGEDACAAPRSFQFLEEPERGRIGNGKGGKET